MSTIENQLTSIEVSKRLRDAGVRQESEFTYYNNGGDWSEVALDKNDRTEYMGYDECCDRVSAFSISEILERLENSDIVDYACLQDPLDGDIRFLLLNLVRNPNKLAEVLLWKIEQEKKEGK